MKPIIGISKNLGHGFRVGLALPLLPEPKKSKREEANEKFIRDARARVQDAIYQYTLSHGVLATPETMSFLDAETKAKLDDGIASIGPNMQAVADAIRIYNDTGSIQQSTKEKLMRNIYEIERITSENSGNSDLHREVSRLQAAYAERQKAISKFIFVLIFLGTFIAYYTSSAPLFWGVVVAVIAIRIVKAKKPETLFDHAMKTRMEQVQAVITSQTISLKDFVMGAA